jgi:tetratricopeptide (TPR) repeat protein
MSSGRRRIAGNWVVALALAGCAGAQRPAAPAASAPPAAASAPAPRAATLVDAERAFAESRYGEAEAAFRALLEQGDASSRRSARRGLARTLSQTGRAKEALALLRADPASSGDLETTTLLAEISIASGDSAAALPLLQGLSERPEARRARLLLGQLLIDRGRRADAEPILMTLITDYNEDRIGNDDAAGLALVGRAAHLLRSPHDANDAFNAAERAGPAAEEVLLWRGELFLQKHDPGHAEEVLNELLQRAPHQPLALVWLAHVKLEQALDFEAARALAESALAVHPGLPQAYFVLAGLALRDLDFEAALRLIEQGLAADREDLELLSLRAAVGFLSENTTLFESARREVFQRNPSYSHFYSIVGEYAEWEHRYDRIVELMREAVSIDDEDAEAHAALGLNLIRAGQESAGVQSLRRAIAKDPFNVRVFNTLNLYEQIIPSDYVTKARGRFTIRYPKAEADILDRYVPGLLERAFRKFVTAYGFTPSEPIGIELYAQREHFAVRTSGLPQTAILGVCFGKTLAALTPHADSLNWGMTLWHELAHVFHIQMSQSHVPRWLTEGLAEYETLVERPEWRRHHDPELFLAWREKRLPQVTRMNYVFSHAEDMQDMATAYYASSQISVMLVDHYGRERVNQLLRLYATGPVENDALARALGGNGGAIDAEFSAYLTQTLARYSSQFVPLDARGSLDELRQRASVAPKDLNAQLRVVVAALAEKQLPVAQSAWGAAHALAPDSADVRFLGARLAAAAGQTPAALAELATLSKSGHDGYAVQMALAELIDGDEQPDALRAALRRAHELDPSQSEPLRALWKSAQEQGDELEEMRILTQLARIEERDVAVYRRLLELLIAHRSLAEAVEVGAAAIYVDLEGARTHSLYAQALALAGRTEDATFEFESAVLCPSPVEELAAAHRDFAEFLRSHGRNARAAAERERALSLDPQRGQPVDPP